MASWANEDVADADMVLYSAQATLCEDDGIAPTKDRASLWHGEVGAYTFEDED